MKENIKANEVAAPTLFVGVGGFGCRIIKRVAELCRAEETENISFVGLDTNVNDLASIANSSAHIYHIQTSNTQTVGDYLNYDEDAFKNWFPKNAVMYDKTVSEGAGQVRAISRLALNSCIKVGRFQPLYDAIDDLFRKDGKEMKQALRVVIASTASGGTGSGIILPLSMMIRDYVMTKYPNTGIIVRSLILLPETLDSVINSNVEKASQARNAYATIKEINAFMMKGSGFMDVTEELKRFRGLNMEFATPGNTDEKKRLALLPFDFCFLMDGQNAEDNTMISTKQYEIQAAQALYEQNIGPMQKGAFSVEDNIIKELANKGNYGRNRFGGIGASVLKYPYEDVADYVAYKWALDNIGGENEVGKWSRYDHEYSIKRKQGEKKGLSESELPKRSSVYTEFMKNNNDSFSKDMRNIYLSQADDRVGDYFTALVDEMHNCLKNNKGISESLNTANFLSKTQDYSKDSQKRGLATANLKKLRSYETQVIANAQKTAELNAEAIFRNETLTAVEKRPYTLEAVLKTSDGNAIHPNAARYVLYLIKDEMDSRVDESAGRLSAAKKKLAKFSKNANEPGMFDVSKLTKKEVEINIDMLCESEVANANIIQEKVGGIEEYYTKLNDVFPKYFKAIQEYGNVVAEHEAYKIGKGYVNEVCAMYERFYASFSSKVSNLLRKQDDLIDSLRFTKGDSIYNICSSRELLDMIADQAIKAQGEEGSLLDPELNAKIFDAVKKNIAFEREIMNEEIVEEDKRVDIFDDIILGYFKEKVRRDCKDINLNAVEAIAFEKRISNRVKKKEENQGSKDAKIFDNVTIDDQLRYIKEKIEFASRLAAPGIQRIKNTEPREINMCAYNKALDEMRNYRMSELFPNGFSAISTDTVSRYEIHFYNALYNLTPDKLNKFASPSSSETRRRKAGTYFQAYANYAKNIGPDSTKDTQISTHIDKRWDSIAQMPELDLDYQAEKMMQIHKAMIYGLIYKAIVYKNISDFKPGKKIYKYIGSEERYTEMIVSNGTLCDEFYEVLDSLYISSAIVEDIGEVIRIKNKGDEVKHSSFEDTAFKKELDDFVIEQVHKGKTSIFEIPIAYYNSLPNAMRYLDEIKSIVDAIVSVLNDQIVNRESRWERQFILCDILREQFLLALSNYSKYEELRNGIEEAGNNPIIEIVFSKIKKEYQMAPEPDDCDTALDDMKKAIDDPKIAKTLLAELKK